MPKITPRTVINIAIKIEQGGEKFYRVVAEKIKDENISDLFKLLSAEEIQHKQDFKNIARNMIGFKETDQVEVITPDNSIINAISSNLIHSASEKIMEYSKRIKSKIEVVEAAIGFEKDSILFYYEIMDMVGEDTKKILNRIINEERRHILKLLKLRKAFAN